MTCSICAAHILRILLRASHLSKNVQKFRIFHWTTIFQTLSKLFPWKIISCDRTPRSCWLVGYNRLSSTGFWDFHAQGHNSCLKLLLYDQHKSRHLKKLKKRLIETTRRQWDASTSESTCFKQGCTAANVIAGIYLVSWAEWEYKLIM